MNCPHCNTEIDEHEAGRCLDAWVAESVMGWRLRQSGEEELDGGSPDWWEDKEGRRTSFVCWHGYEEAVWNPSTDIAAAWEVVEKLNNNGYIVEIMNDLVAWSVCFIHADELDKRHMSDWKASLPVQICCAALKGSRGRD